VIVVIVWLVLVLVTRYCKECPISATSNLTMKKYIVVLCIVLGILVFCVSAKRHWLGSKLGQGKQHYNKEREALQQGIDDYAAVLQAGTYHSRRPLLCVTFIRASLRQSINLISNVMVMKSYCDWAVVIYEGEEENVAKMCEQEITRPYFVHCALSAAANTKYVRRGDGSNNNGAATASAAPAEATEEADVDLGDSNVNADTSTESATNSSIVSIPKTVLYADLLPILSRYKRVFLMDEDISLLDFDMNKLLLAWDCSFPNQPPPLVVQPLVRESTQVFNFVGVKAWRNISSVKSSATGYVEQQVPLFDALFFEWYVRRVLSLTRSYSLERGVDWGGDRSWCGAAASYAAEVLRWPERWPEYLPKHIPPYVPPMEAIEFGPDGAFVKPVYHACGIIATTSIHHLNSRTMSLKRSKRTLFRSEGFAVVQRYIDLFPTWVLLDVAYKPNPRSKQSRGRYPMNFEYNASCAANFM
jgi:hypothetical protein